jgi:hypothetical protein
MRFDRQVESREPHLLERISSGAKRLADDLVERRAAPQGERSRSEPCATACDDLGAVAAAAEDLAQLRDVDLHHLRRCRRRCLAPQAVNQRLRRDGRALAEREHRQQRPRLPRADRD